MKLQGNWAPAHSQRYPLQAAKLGSPEMHPLRTLSVTPLPPLLCRIP